MISKNAELYCKDPLWKIMGYKEAKLDNTVVYDCHHKAGLYISSKELKKKGLYYNRPASELMFLHPYDHQLLHKNAKKMMDKLFKQSILLTNN